MGVDISARVISTHRRFMQSQRAAHSQVNADAGLATIAVGAIKRHLLAVSAEMGDLHTPEQGGGRGLAMDHVAAVDGDLFDPPVHKGWLQGPTQRLNLR